MLFIWADLSAIAQCKHSGLFSCGCAQSVHWMPQPMCEPGLTQTVTNQNDICSTSVIFNANILGCAFQNEY